MSKYLVEYISASKGALVIETMLDWHLVSAYRKMTEAGMPEDSYPLQVAAALEAEIRERELDPRWAGGKAPGHPLLNDKEPKRLPPHAHVDAVWEDAEDLEARAVDRAVDLGRGK